MTLFEGVYVAVTTPFREGDLTIDADAFGAHCSWLCEEGISGLVPGGSLGEYESMTADEREQLVRVAVEAAQGRAKVVPGVSAASPDHAHELALRARDAGADGVMALPPTNYAARDDEVIAHFARIAEAGLPIVVYNNPFSTKLDLSPALLAKIAEIEGVAGVKEFSTDARRVSEILEKAPGLEVICGADDIALESAVMGATGWIGGFTGVFPRATIRVWELGRKQQLAEALPLYRRMLPALRWDTTPLFVQAIKLAGDEAGTRGGGRVRPPRQPLSEQDADQVRRCVQAVLREEP